jgi:hypothetical protein
VAVGRNACPILYRFGSTSGGSRRVPEGGGQGSGGGWQGAGVGRKGASGGFFRRFGVGLEAG